MPLPPFPLIAGGMILIVMDGTERDREFVADLERQASGLRKPNMMRVRGRAAADQARLAPDVAQVILGALPLWLPNKQLALVNLTA